MSQEIPIDVYVPGCNIVSPSSVSIVDGGLPPAEGSGEPLESAIVITFTVALSDIA
jgi:hypothetical protein